MPIRLPSTRRARLRRGPLLLLALLFLCASAFPQAARPQSAPDQSAPDQVAPGQVAPGVWFLLGDASKGYSNTTLIEMRDYLIVVDANYPGRAKELITLIPTLSPKPVRYVFDTHAHGDHSYGNSTWTKVGATTLAFAGVAREMDRWEPTRWQSALSKRDDVRATAEANVERPKNLLHANRFVLKDSTREVDFLFLGWGHTPGDGYVWLPREHILATGDAAVNGPRNWLADASIEQWPRVLDRAVALHPRIVLPGHGARGGIEILTGQQRFLSDLFTAVKAQLAAGKPALDISLPPANANWIPKDLTLDIEATESEIRGHAPAGALPHASR
jgi:cyclase